MGLTVIGHSDDLYDSVNRGVDGITHLWGVAETLKALPEDLTAFHNSRTFVLTPTCKWAKWMPWCHF